MSPLLTLAAMSLCSDMDYTLYLNEVPISRICMQNEIELLCVLHENMTAQRGNLAIMRSDGQYELSELEFAIRKTPSHETLFIRR